LQGAVLAERRSRFGGTPGLRALAVALVTLGLMTPAAWAQKRDSVLFDAATAERAAVVKTLERLVNIETGTGNAEGLATAARLLEAELRSRGFTVTRQKAAGAAVGDNVVGRLKGRLDGKGGRNLLLISHMDTVHPRGTLARSPFRIDGPRAYGPGIADDKGGAAVILHALKLLTTYGFRDFGSITVVFNTDEEKGSFGSRDLIQQEAQAADYVLSFEPTSAERESFFLGTSGIAYVQADIRGRASHAGAAPEQGVNALVEAADLVRRTADLDDKARGLRFNWTLAKAGTAANVIPESATINADLRYALRGPRRGAQGARGTRAGEEAARGRGERRRHARPPGLQRRRGRAQARGQGRGLLPRGRRRGRDRRAQRRRHRRRLRRALGQARHRGIGPAGRGLSQRQGGVRDDRRHPAPALHGRAPHHGPGKQMKTSPPHTKETPPCC
jgi:hypothetical protein